MRRPFFHHLGCIISSPRGDYEMMAIYNESRGVREWWQWRSLSDGYTYLHRRRGQPWMHAPMRVSVSSWWARLISSEEWPPEIASPVSIDDEGTLTIEFDGDPQLTKIWTGGTPSRWRANLPWGARGWSFMRLPRE
jgi:hypothetical protein